MASMDQAMNRIHIVAPNLQVEYEGDQNFIENRLMELIGQFISLSEQMPVSSAAASPVQAEGRMASVPEISTNTVAQIIGVKTGSELALAGLAKVNIIKGKSTVTRQEILDEMRGASTYFRETYASNLSSYLDTLVKGKRINLVSRGTFALAAGERNRLEDALRASQ